MREGDAFIFILLAIFVSAGLIFVYVLHKRAKKRAEAYHATQEYWRRHWEQQGQLQNQPTPTQSNLASQAPADQAVAPSPEPIQKTQRELDAEYWEKREKGYFVLGEYDLDINFEYKYKGDKRHLLLKCVLMEPNPVGRIYFRAFCY